MLLPHQHSNSSMLAGEVGRIDGDDGRLLVSATPTSFTKHACWSSERRHSGSSYSSFSLLPLPLLLPESRRATFLTFHYTEPTASPCSPRPLLAAHANASRTLHHCPLVCTAHSDSDLRSIEEDDSAAFVFLLSMSCSRRAMECLVRFLEITPASWTVPCQRVETQHVHDLFETVPVHLELVHHYLVDPHLCKEVLCLADYLGCTPLEDVASIVLATLVYGKNTSEMMEILLQERVTPTQS